MEARLTIGDYSIHLADSIPASLPEYREHAGFVDEVNINGSEGDIFFLAVTVGGRWPRLVVAQRQEIVGDLPGVLVVPETNILFVGAGTRVTVYDLENPRLVWEDYAIGGFSLWERHGDVVLAVGPHELTGWSIHGARLWTTRFVFLEYYRVADGIVHIDDDGRISSFPLTTGPVA